MTYRHSVGVNSDVLLVEAISKARLYERAQPPLHIAAVLVLEQSCVIDQTQEVRYHLMWLVGRRGGRV